MSYIFIQFHVQSYVTFAVLIIHNPRILAVMSYTQLMNRIETKKLTTIERKSGVLSTGKDRQGLHRLPSFLESYRSRGSR